MYLATQNVLMVAKKKLFCKLYQLRLFLNNMEKEKEIAVRVIN